MDQVEGRGRSLRSTVVNNGARRGTEVVQVYVRAPESLVRRPDRELVGFAKVIVDAGGRATVASAAGGRRLPLLGHARHTRGGTDPGRYELLVGTSSHEIWATTEITWGGTPAS